ncbi:MAG: putative nicotinate phosphoribosyltransferase [Oscillospiraceae bacterium]|jgi:nicotinate phosphoribosyltransferase|nr:putative nicotinate phosphoribosyltransferase [Oscillospiraceae bacterium]
MIDIKNERNLTMLTDFYELTMANGYLLKEMQDTEVVFDMFFRKIPDGGGYAIAAGLEQLMQYIDNLQFSKEDIAFLRSKNTFSEAFLNYLENFKFECDLWAIKEGTPIFPGEPLVVVKGPAIQAQLIETMVLLTINFQSLIATKSTRMNRVAQGRAIMEFGSRRAQSYDAAMLGARAAYIGGCTSTACVIADQYYNIPAVGTMAHSWVQLFPDEYSAFKAYAEIYPDNCTLLIDTYDVLHSGMPNAIRVFNEVLLPLGHRPKGVRIDSGDIAYLSKKVRTLLDEAGFEDCKIVASNSLDEYIIRDLIMQDAKVDLFGVGENLITGRSEPVFGGVYKLVAVQEGTKLAPRIKISESPEKVTTPGFKKLYRLYDRKSGKASADYITLFEEKVDDSKPLTIFDPNAIWKKKTLEDFEAVSLLEPIYEKGKRLYHSPTLKEIQDFCKTELGRMWDEIKRFEYPHRYYVDLSESLWTLKTIMLNDFERKIRELTHK